MGARLDENRATIDHGVAVFTGGIVFCRTLVIGHAALRQHCTDTNFVAIGVGWATLFHDITAEPRTIIDTEHAGYAADNTTDGAAYDSAHRTSCALAIARTTLNASGDTLSLSNGGKSHHGDDGSGSKKTADHDDLQF
jgi:hypothetical protein